MLNRIRGWPRPVKRAVMVAADVAIINGALWFAFALKFDSLTHGLKRNPWFYVGTTVASLLAFWALGLYRSIVRYIGVRAVATVLLGTIVSAVVLYVLSQTIARPPLRPSTVVIYGLVALTWVASSRYLARWVLLQPSRDAEAVAIYGAGEAGIRLKNALKGGRGLAVVGFLDDKLALQGSIIGGIKVWPADRLPSLVKNLEVTRVLLAVPSASRRRRAEIIRKVEGLGLRVQTIPDLDDIASGRAKVDQLREIDVADLLGRDPVPPVDGLLDACIRGKVVMVTGAGGSIGSELCRQILRLGPRELILLEMSELALYNVERELRSAMARDGLDVGIKALLGNVRHKNRLLEILGCCGVQTIYHAAAYKHVPIVEQNVIAGVRNNVIGTWYAAEAALERNVENFVLVSTDKAVNPTNVMGATKRMAELVLQGLHHRGCRTRFSIVRFGNVLESSGSVVPLFREQIRNGGPVTVTHPDVIRYFMTIPEASQLVLQAGSMAEGGDVFVLDMGKPVRIHDLAQRMVNLAGLTIRDDAHPDGDIEIQITGLRPAEKLFEELLIGKDVTGTGHPRIMRAREHSLPWDEMRRLLDEMVVAVRAFDTPTARHLLVKAVQEYRPDPELVDQIWCCRSRDVESDTKVTNLEAFRALGRREATVAAAE